jgi:molybdenum cofactor guanylyltransferase
VRISGIVLVGGGSRRMGVNKALLEIGGVPLISRLSSRLSAVAEDVVISCSEQDSEVYRFLGLPIAADLYPGLGPLAGLHAGLTWSRADWNAVAACDLPFAPEGLLQYMAAIAAEAGSGVQAVVPVAAGDKAQPLFALYHKGVLPSLEEALKQRRLRVMEWLGGLSVIYVPEDEFPGSPSDNKDALLNMNTPGDYQAAVQRESSGEGNT